MTRVLDYGYVEHIETWGSDASIIEAARMSTSKGFQGWGPRPCSRHCQTDISLPGGGCASNVPQKDCPKCHGSGQEPGDEKLLRYLWEHKHHTPFEMAGMTLEVQAPIFVFREWHRHRTQSYNELSARYTALPDLYYVPSVERLMGSKQATKNKQGSEAGFSEQKAKDIQYRIGQSVAVARGMYETLLSLGVAREVARVVVPVSQYSRMRASANLRNWLSFLTLRMAPGAQWEIRQYAEQVGQIVKNEFPRTWALFEEGL